MSTLQRRVAPIGTVLSGSKVLRSLLLAATAATAALVPSGGAHALTAIESLGKNVFFDTTLSTPRGKQACASCHDATRGWTFPNATVNRTTVAAPGAVSGAVGSIKTPPNAYASLYPDFQFSALPVPFIAPWLGGNFWDGRAEGCGETAGPCPVGKGVVSATIKPSDLPASKRGIYAKYLGPTADQALNPFPNPVEQNIPIDQVCNVVKLGKYGGLYRAAYGEAIDCSAYPAASPAYLTSFKRIAVALAAWQSSSEVNSFSAKRDRALRQEKDRQFPLRQFTRQENLGHDLFYGIASDLNPARPDGSVPNGSCNACHNGVPVGETPDPVNGTAKHELYTDSRFHNIGVPFNPAIPGVPFGSKTGLAAHVPNGQGVVPGLFKTPTLRNASKGLGGGFTKAFTHNGWFKTLEGLVHFYNTRDVLPRCAARVTTEVEALRYGCWPAPEFANPAIGVVGNLGLNKEQELAIVAYVKTLSDTITPRKP